jgi:EXS family
VLPFVLRFIQCLIVLHTQKERQQLFNAIKYTTALPVVFLSWVKYSVPLSQWYSFWKPLWVASAVVNTSYSFYWDVERDWDIRLFHRSAPCSAFQVD